MTPTQQGWYYSFLSLAALYTLFDLGLSIVLVQLSAHFFVGVAWLPNGEYQGENQIRFTSLLGRSVRIYGSLALIYLSLLIPAGLVFFGYRDSSISTEISQWFPQWCALILGTSIGILILPFIAIVEGSGRVAEAYGIRLAQGIGGALGCWCCLLSGRGLWAPAAMYSVAAIVGISWLVIKRRCLLINAFRGAYGLSWRDEVWPLQWRIGLTWLAGYLLTQIYTPILFHSQGPVVAGQMGLSLTIANMLALVSQSWIAYRIPAMTQAATRQEWRQLDSLFARDFFLSGIVFGIGIVALCVFHGLLQKTAYESRLLPFWTFAGLLGVTFTSHIVGGLAAQLRSFRREPLVWLSLTGAVLTVCGAISVAKLYSAGGIVLTMLCVQIVFILPSSFWLWRKCNREWRA